MESVHHPPLCHFVVLTHAHILLSTVPTYVYTHLYLYFFTVAARTTIQHQISNGLNDLNVPDEVGVSRREPSYDVWNNLEDPDL